MVDLPTALVYLTDGFDRLDVAPRRVEVVEVSDDWAFRWSKCSWTWMYPQKQTIAGIEMVMSNGVVVDLEDVTPVVVEYLQEITVDPATKINWDMK